MLHVITHVPNQILSSADGPAVELVNPGGNARICIVCEHASPRIPVALGDLGVTPEHRMSHAAWDPGAEQVARSMAQQLDAPLVLARFSRLVYDCNRPPERDDAMPARAEVIDIPGNVGLSAEERAARTREIYDVFHGTISGGLDQYVGAPAFVTVHSFTPVWYGEPRATEIGLLHDADPALAEAMLAEADPSFRTELNQPYSAADGVTHTLARHAIPRGLPNVMIEIRNDLIASEAEAEQMASLLSGMLQRALARQVDAA